MLKCLFDLAKQINLFGDNEKSITMRYFWDILLINHHHFGMIVCFVSQNYTHTKCVSTNIKKLIAFLMIFANIHQKTINQNL